MKFIFLIFFILLLSACSTSRVIIPDEALEPLEASKVTLYYYSADKDKDASGNILCSAQGLVGVESVIAPSNTILKDTLDLLLKGELTAAEKEQGITTEFPLPGVRLESFDLTEGVLTLRFLDPQNKTGGGACRAAILWAQIEATAKQFNGVQSVRFEPEELFQP